MFVELVVQAGMLHIAALRVGSANPSKYLPLILLVVIVACGLDGEEISVVTVACIAHQWLSRTIVEY